MYQMCDVTWLSTSPYQFLHPKRSINIWQWKLRLKWISIYKSCTNWRCLSKSCSSSGQEAFPWPAHSSLPPCINTAPRPVKSWCHVSYTWAGYFHLNSTWSRHWYISRWFLVTKWEIIFAFFLIYLFLHPNCSCSSLFSSISSVHLSSASPARLWDSSASVQKEAVLPWILEKRGTSGCSRTKHLPYI